MCDRTFPRVQVFGPLRVYDEHGNEHVPTRKAVRTLLLFLALNGKCVHVEQAMDVLWPNLTVPEARHRLNRLLQELPDALAPLIAREGDTLVMRAQTDLEEYQKSLALVLTRALNGEMAPEVLYDTWTEPARRQVQAAISQLIGITRR